MVKPRTKGSTDCRNGASGAFRISNEPASVEIAIAPMHSVLLGLWEGQRQTVLFVTHDLGEALTLADRIILLSARPGRVKQDFRVDFPRPRDAVTLRETRQYAELFSHVWHSLGEEFAKGHSA